MKDEIIIPKHSSISFREDVFKLFEKVKENSKEVIFDFNIVKFISPSATHEFISLISKKKICSVKIKNIDKSVFDMLESQINLRKLPFDLTDHSQKEIHLVCT